MKKLSLILAASALIAGLAACKEKAYQLSDAEYGVAKDAADNFAARLQYRLVSVKGQDSPPIDGVVTATIDVGNGQTREAICTYNTRGGCQWKPEEKASHKKNH